MTGTVYRPRLSYMTETLDGVDMRLDAILAGFTPRQIEQAQELLDLGGLIPAGRPATWYAISSDGTTTYETTTWACTCPARRTCYHMLAAMVTAALRMSATGATL